MIPKEIMKTVARRMKELTEDPKVQEKMMSFECDEDAHNWLSKLAVWTLFVPVAQRS